MRLWCTNPDAERVGCSTKHMPWADGTPCSNSAANESMVRVAKSHFWRWEEWVNKDVLCFHGKSHCIWLIFMLKCLCTCTVEQKILHCCPSNVIDPPLSLSLKCSYKKGFLLKANVHWFMKSYSCESLSQVNLNHDICCDTFLPGLLAARSCSLFYPISKQPRLPPWHNTHENADVLCVFLKWHLRNCLDCGLFVSVVHSRTVRLKEGRSANRRSMGSLVTLRTVLTHLWRRNTAVNKTM